MIKIAILNTGGKNGSDEEIAANDLKDVFANILPSNAKGELYIAYNLTLTGQTPRDVDILVFGTFQDFILKGFYTNNPKYPCKDLMVKGFCVPFELKLHSARDIEFNGTSFYVSYNNELKDVTHQSEGQRYSVANYFKNVLGYMPRVTNMIWFKSITESELKSFNINNPVGAVASTFTLKEFIGKLINQDFRPYYDKDFDMYIMDCSLDGHDLAVDAKDKIFVTKRSATGLTARKLNLLAQSKVSNLIRNNHFGRELTIYTGRAGTGKTIRLIEAAMQLANSETGKRCLILTYNHALVSDIRRLFYFMDIPDGIDSYTIQIQTLHSFFMLLMKEVCGVERNNFVNTNFEKKYNSELRNLRDTVKDIMDSEDIKVLKEDNSLAIDFDYVLIDEAQDWSEMEKSILFKIYGPEHIIVADGVDQFIRSGRKMDWSRGVDADINSQKKDLRQKYNLALFVNAFAKEVGLQKWNVEPNKDYPGGKVYIKKGYNLSFHKKDVIDYCNSPMCGCENYDVLFLAPPQMVELGEDNSHHFRDLALWEKHGIHIFDGTNEQTRCQYPTDMKAFRLYQYESCRGLEGWVTVCMQFDKLIETKVSEAKNIDLTNDLELTSKEEAEKNFVWLWSMMPLTRAIDTLVITIKDTKSEVADHLRDVASKHPEFIVCEI